MHIYIYLVISVPQRNVIYIYFARELFERGRRKKDIEIDIKWAFTFQPLLQHRLHICSRFGGNCVRYNSDALRPRAELIVIEHRSTIGNPSVGERRKESKERGKGGARRRATLS